MLKLKTLRDGGILDPDDFIQDVVEDKELVNALSIRFNSKLILISQIN